MDINLTMFAQAIAFFILFWVSKKFLWPPLITAIDDRRKKIADGLAEAEKGKSALADGEKQKAVMLKEARAQAADVKALNDKQLAATIEEAKTQARVEAERIIVAAKAQIEQEKQKAKISYANKSPRWPLRVPKKFCVVKSISRHTPKC